MKLKSLSGGCLVTVKAESSNLDYPSHIGLIDSHLADIMHKDDVRKDVICHSCEGRKEGLLNLFLNLLHVVCKRGGARVALSLLVCLLGSGLSAVAEQRPVVSVKTNLLYDALLSPNLGVEVGLSRKLTLDVSGNVNLWSVEGHTWKHWQVQPELRYWLCQRFAGHFVGLETHVGQFNVGNIDLGVSLLGTDFRKLRDRRYQGWQGGLGLTYGYAWIVSQHWNVEAELGLGYSYTKYDAYPCATCGTKVESGRSHNYFGVTKAQVGIAYIF